VTAQSMTLSGKVEGTTAAALVPQVAAAATHGFKVAAPVPGALMLTRTFRPGWSVVLGIAMIVFALVAGSFAVGLFVPFFVWFFVVVGVLLIVFVKQSETASLVVTDRDGGVDVSATGTVGDELWVFVGGLVPNAVVSVELPLPAASEKPPPRWALVTMAVTVVAAVAAAAVVGCQQIRTEDVPSYSFQISSSVSSKVAMDVRCGRIGFLAARNVYRCRGGGVDECWLLTDNSNVSGSGLRPTLTAEDKRFGDDCRPKI
jgi:hypothetical protein